MAISDITYKALSPHSGDKIVEPTLKSRAIDAAKWGIGGGAVETAARMLIHKIRGPIFPKPNAQTIISSVVFGGILGAFDRDLRNAIIRAKQKGEGAPKLLKSRDKAIFSFGLKKEAGIGKTLYRAGRGIGIGLFGKGKNLPEKVFGAAVKTTAIGGAGLGAYKGIQAIRKNRPGPNNYTAMLRNNILARNISPDELSVEDMESVRKRGMK